MKDKVDIVFTGDLSFSSFFQKAYEDDELISQNVLNYMKGSDACVVNYESPITPLRQTRKRRLAHRTDPEALLFLKSKLPNPILSFANNHMMDYGSIGLIDSIEEAIRNDISFIGAGRDREEAAKHVVVGDEIKVAILSIQYKAMRKVGPRFIGPLHEDLAQDIKDKIAKIRPQVDWVVLVYHGGDEFLNAPMPYTRKLLKKFLEMDVDVIVGHHPHVVQGYEYVGKKAIFYSLGNFIFDSTYQRAQEGAEDGMILKISFSKNDFNFSNLPIFIDRQKMRIEEGKDSPFFIDLKSKNYKALWTYEAMRKLDIMDRARVLRETELEEIEIHKENKRVEHEQRVLATKLRMMEKNQENEENDEFDSESLEEEINDSAKDKDIKANNMRTHIRSILSFVYRKIGIDRKQVYKSLIIKIGRLKYRLFYKNKDRY